MLVFNTVVCVCERESGCQDIIILMQWNILQQCRYLQLKPPHTKARCHAWKRDWTDWRYPLFQGTRLIGSRVSLEFACVHAAHTDDVTGWTMTLCGCVWVCMLVCVCDVCACMCVLMWGGGACEGWGRVGWVALDYCASELAWHTCALSSGESTNC